MNTAIRSIICAACQSWCGAVLLTASSAQAQNLFATDLNGNINEFTPNGGQSTFAGGLHVPYGLAFDSAGNLFWSYGVYPGGSINRITPNGVQTTIASAYGPAGLAFNSAGDLFDAETNGKIHEFTPDGTESLFASGLSSPIGLAFNNAGNLFVTDYGAGCIYQFTPGGTKSLFASGLSSPTGLSFNNAGDLFVSATGSGDIYEFTPSGARSTFASGLQRPFGLVFDSAGRLFAADYYSGTINEFTPDGAETTFASGYGPFFLAFQPVPEPSALALLAIGATALFVRYHKFTK